MNIKNRYIFNQMAVTKGWLIKTFLLLLLLFVACGEPDDMFGTIHGDDEEIELTINTLLPDGGVSTRTAPAEKITSITALAFDRNHELIKVQTSEVVQSTTSDTTGTFKVTVPQRTRRIHFIAKNNGEFTEITESDYGKTDVGLLVNRISSIQNSQDADGISNALHYWQMLDFESAEDLKDLSDELSELDKEPIKNDAGQDVYRLPLIRNMAKITLNLKDGMTGHIAGVLNYNTTGTIVPYLKDEDGYKFGYQTDKNHELPESFVITSDVDECSELGLEHYLFEEYNDVGDLIYVMCYIDNDGSGTEDAGHFYKVALVKPTFTGVEDKYYYVIRNQAYNINIVGKLDVTLGKTDYSDAVQNGKPINDSEKEQVHLDFEPDEVYMYIGEPGTVTVKIPEGIAELQIGFPSERFDADGVIAKNTAGNNLENSTTTNGNIHISTYAVTGLSEIVLSMNLKSSIQDAISGMELQFIGSGEDKIVNDKLVVHVLKRDALNVTPTAVEIPRTKGNSFSVNVIIPRFDNYDGAYELTVNDKNNKYNITAPGTLALHDGVYNVEKGQTYTFEFELREDGTEGEEHTIDFHLATDYHDYDATTIVTLIDNVVHDQDYEIWVDKDNSTWTGTENSVTFFGYNKDSVTNGTTPNGFRTEFYDTGANSHKSQSMIMGSDDSFTFTIPEGGNRYLTMLVAADGGTPSINLTGTLANGESWTTATSSDAVVPDKYNFGNGEIGTAGRLIRYELKPGTYTLQGSDAAAYLLYYMRLTKEKPVMTDVAQPLIADYELSWSGATYVNTDAKGYLKINDSIYIVDQDNLNHTVELKSENNSLNTSLNLNLSTFTLSEIDVQVATKVIAFEGTNSNKENTTDNNQSKTVQSNTCTLYTYNAGNYATSGTINEPDYKYKAFYEKLHLNSVQYEVKSPIIPGLYTSLEGDKLTPVDTFTNMDDAWAIGFRMPMVVPAPHSELLPVSEKYGNYTIDIYIPEWTKRSDNTSTGLGVIVGNDKNYTLGKQSNSNSGGTEMLHPREGWTYKIAFESIPDSKQIVPSLLYGNKKDDTDHHYFIYNGTIAKEVTIPTPYEVINLNLQSLEFRSASNNGDNQTYNLNFGDDFYLKATISQDDAQKYAGKFVKLQGNFSNLQNGGNSSIDWSKSRQDGSSIVDRNNNGNFLQFEIKADQTDYEIHWKFVRPEGNTSNPVQFTYTVSNPEYTGDNTATATINLSNSETELIRSEDFTNVGSWNLWSEGRQPSVNSTNGFCLINPEKAAESYLPQYHLANGLTLETGTYKITMYICGDREGKIDRVGLGSWDTGPTYSNSPMTFTTEWQEKTVEVTLPTATENGAGFVMCQSGSYVGELYIKWLRVEKITNN